MFPSFLESKLFSGFSQDSAQLSIRLKTQQCFVIHEYTLKFQVFSLSYNIFYHSVIHDYRGILVNMVMLKISDAADFNSFLKLVLVSDNEKSPEQV